MKITVALIFIILTGCSGTFAWQLRADKVARIINGEDTEIENFPWQASLQDLTGSHFCGAVVVGDKIAITAGHCLSGAYQIRVGSSDYLSGGEVYRVSETVIHPEYDIGNGTFPNDIGVLLFDDIITAGGGAKAIELAAEGEDFAGDDCVITGWGRTSSSGPLPQILQRADTKVITNDQCDVLWGSEDSINSGHVCVFNENVGSCNGDSGGPLTCREKVVGVTSWGIVGCAVTSPSVYSRVSYFREFIDKYM